MTAHRWSLVLFAALPALMLPACLHIETTPVAPPNAPSRMGMDAARRVSEQALASDHKTEFRSLLPRPGVVVSTRPASKDKDVMAAQKADTAIPSQAGGPLPPSPPGGGLFVSEPRPFPYSLPSLAGTSPESPLLAAVRADVAGRPQEAIEALKSLDKLNQDLILALLPILSRITTTDLIGDPVSTAMLAEQLRSTASRLEPRAALRIGSVAFCRRVSGFGQYEPRPENEPYHPNDKALLYLEVRNLVSQPAVGPQGETHLTYAQCTVEILDAKQRRVEQPDPEDWRRQVPKVRTEKKRFTRGPVSDFHVLYEFAVPATPGVYTVVVEIRDPIGRRSVKTVPIQFLVAGP